MKKSSLLMGIALHCSVFSMAQSQGPNIIMISIDDLNDWVGVYGGHPQALTPNIDKLASQSMVFRNASCPGPVCGPSRSALLSGFVPSTTGIYGNNTNMLNSEIVQKNATLPEYFSKNGYITLSSGKIFHRHFTENGDDFGHWAFDIWNRENGTDGGVQEDKMYSSHLAVINGEKIENPEYVFHQRTNDMFFGPTKGGFETMLDYKTAKWAEKQLEGDFEKPFFMSVGISKPHLPFIVPQEFFDLYNLDSIKVPDFLMDDLDDIVDKNGNKMFEPQTTFLWAKHYGLLKEVTRAYLATVSFADACVGIVLDALAESEYADNTIVLLWGDHGWHLGEKLRYGKATLWRESTQLPFIIHLPGMTEQQDCYRNVNLMDIYPTLIDLCDLPRKELDGNSIVPLLNDPTLEWTPTLTTLGKDNHAIIYGKWHYISRRNGAEELYDNENDPMQWENLANVESDEIKRIKNYMRSFLPTTNAESIVLNEPVNQNRGKLDDTIKPKRVLDILK